MDTKRAQAASTESPLELSQSPLVRVLSQVRWPEFGGLNIDEVARDAGRRLAADYPLKAQQNETEVILTLEGAQQKTTGVIHRFMSLDRKWTVSLGKTFMALETTDYTDHSDFVSKLNIALTALTEAWPIPVWSRIGYRYTNRLEGAQDIDSLEDYFEAIVLGGLPAASEDMKLIHSISESLYRIDESMLLVRSARLGPKASIDPTLQPVDNDSWVLDLDASHQVDPGERFSVTEVTKQAEALSRLAYKHFRSVIKDGFVTRFR